MAEVKNDLWLRENNLGLFAFLVCSALVLGDTAVTATSSCLPPPPFATQLSVTKPLVTSPEYSLIRPDRTVFPTSKIFIGSGTQAESPKWKSDRSKKNDFGKMYCLALVSAETQPSTLRHRIFLDQASRDVTGKPSPTRSYRHRRSLSGVSASPRRRRSVTGSWWRWKRPYQ